VLAGKLTAHIMRDTQPPRTKANEPTGTRTQEISYRDGSEEVARVHQYLRTGGVIGASGLPDPKRICENGILYRLRKPPNNIKEWIYHFASDLRDRIMWSCGLEVD